MSILFGGQEILCDGCAASIQQEIGQLAPGALFITMGAPKVTPRPEIIVAPAAQRHFCPACAPVARDLFASTFPRLPVVLALAEPEPGDALQRPPEDPRARTLATPMRDGACRVCGQGLRGRKAIFTTLGKVCCSPECADKVEQADREREEFLREKRGLGLPP